MKKIFITWMEEVKEIILLQGRFASTEIGRILFYDNYKLWKTKKNGIVNSCLQFIVPVKKYFPF